MAKPVPIKQDGPIDGQNEVYPSYRALSVSYRPCKQFSASPDYDQGTCYVWLTL